MRERVNVAMRERVTNGNPHPATTVLLREAGGGGDGGGGSSALVVQQLPLNMRPMTDRQIQVVTNLLSHRGQAAKRQWSGTRGQYCKRIRAIVVIAVLRGV